MSQGYIVKHWGAGEGRDRQSQRHRDRARETDRERREKITNAMWIRRKWVLV